MSELPQFLIWYIVFVFSTTCHEAAHALVARVGGDETAYALGHVTLDPTPHIRREPIGMVLMPILSFFTLGWLVGWASVPFNPAWGERYPKRLALMSLAGPFANFSLAAIALVALRGLSAAGVFHLGDVGGVQVGAVQLPEGYDFSSPLGALALALTVLLKLNVILGLYNLIPLPPLDGASVVEGLAPRYFRPLYQRLRYSIGLQLLGLYLASKALQVILAPVLRFVALLLYG
jgi:Zn-dependent protease